MDNKRILSSFIWTDCAINYKPDLSLAFNSNPGPALDHDSGLYFDSGSVQNIHKIKTFLITLLVRIKKTKTIRNNTKYKLTYNLANELEVTDRERALCLQVQDSYEYKDLHEGINLAPHITKGDALAPNDCRRVWLLSTDRPQRVRATSIALVTSHRRSGDLSRYRNDVSVPMPALSQPELLLSVPLTSIALHKLVEVDLRMRGVTHDVASPLVMVMEPYTAWSDILLTSFFINALNTRVLRVGRSIPSSSNARGFDEDRAV
ncbi:hypothetical protein EVAR_80171_1 [Eumeta japonica]|uniref:Uncharacterized protein n=1 Tax=Eumeta variegata TaxID=151549 RepID=A0A4C1Y8M6_EUMVA|nr:hypothetical protein EVAR_80171_1 [Eumeta japonica]